MGNVRVRDGFMKKRRMCWGKQEWYERLKRKWDRITPTRVRRQEEKVVPSIWRNIHAWYSLKWQERAQTDENV